ncbi:sialidase family protein [Paenibacillaceae bacterium WGS1546]|uniref:sialidase family protein n=1 Tax=Cohnella sp. WGS1546 TaxID=3366810 RepID=UPI00372D02C4
MKGYSDWSYRPYRPYDQYDKRFLPYICRVAPDEKKIELEWFDEGDRGAHLLYWRKFRTNDPFEVKELNGSVYTIEPLEPECDYEFYVARASGSGASEVRLARTGQPIGTVVNYLHPEDEIYAFSGRSLCSPSLVKLPSGALLASMDVFAGKAPQNLTLIFRSDDGGRSWRYVTELMPCFWGKLFVHRGELYMLANSTEYGDLLIGRSADEGLTWTSPVTIMTGAGSWMGRGPHKAPMQVVELDNRLYTGIDYGSWSSGGHSNALLSIDADADLMDAGNWQCTGFLPYDPAWEDAAPGATVGGGLEGNAVVGPDGDIYNVLRYQMKGYGKALVLKGNKDRPEESLQFHGFADFNGGSNCKFELLYDEPSGLYWAIANEVVDERTPHQRNVLSLSVSKDLQSFRMVKRMLDYRHENPDDVGFQYVSMLIDGEDLLYLCRTAINKAKNMHDANYSTFHRIERFRQYAAKE